MGIAHAVNDEYPIEALAELVAPPTYRGVDGQLRDLIFAANSRKPEVVFWDVSVGPFRFSSRARRIRPVNWDQAVGIG
jgi:hypothetical protein